MKFDTYFLKNKLGTVHRAAVVLMINAAEWLPLEQVDESQVALSETLGWNYNTQLSF